MPKKIPSREEIRATQEAWRKASMLTPEELAELRRKADESTAYFKMAFAHLRPTTVEPKSD